MAVLESFRVQRIQFEALGASVQAQQTPCEVRAHVRPVGEDRAAVLLVARFFEGTPKPPFRLEVAVEGLFQLDPGESPEALARGTGPAALYPYLRDEVGHLTLRGGLPPLLLPPLRLAGTAVDVKAKEQAN